MAHRTLTVARRKARIGRLFILPFTIGFLCFFLQPLVLSLYYSFCNLTPQTGFKPEWLGLGNYVDIFARNVDYIPQLQSNLQLMARQVPFVLVFSLFIAIILNQKFRGRAFVRAIFFLPVIISSGIIISILKEDVFNQSLTAGSAQASYIFKSSGIEDMLWSTGLPTSIVNYITGVIDGIFDLLWKSGVQILIFLAAVQGIPGQLYEASVIEGATPWESFWKITFPMISPMILVNIIYSIVDSFTDYNNGMMQMIMRMGYDNFSYAYACAMAWVYMLIILAILGVVTWIVNRLIRRRVA